MNDIVLKREKCQGSLQNRTGGDVDSLLPSAGEELAILLKNNSYFDRKERG